MCQKFRNSYNLFNTKWQIFFFSIVKNHAIFVYGFSWAYDKPAWNENLFLAARMLHTIKAAQILPQQVSEGREPRVYNTGDTIQALLNFLLFQNVRGFCQWLATHVHHHTSHQTLSNTITVTKIE